eukprot:2735115-Prymnesium_polylepis.1
MASGDACVQTVLEYDSEEESFDFFKQLPSSAGAQHARARARRTSKENACESAAAFGGQRLSHQQLTNSCLKRSSCG